MEQIWPSFLFLLHLENSWLLDFVISPIGWTSIPCSSEHKHHCKSEYKPRFGCVFVMPTSTKLYWHTIATSQVVFQTIKGKNLNMKVYLCYIHLLISFMIIPSVDCTKDLYFVAAFTVDDNNCLCLHPQIRSASGINFSKIKQSTIEHSKPGGDENKRTMFILTKNGLYQSFNVVSSRKNL